VATASPAKAAKTPNVSLDSLSIQVKVDLPCLFAAQHCIDVFMLDTAANPHSNAVLSSGANNFPKHHSGQFRKGDDPRRFGGSKLYDGMTLAQLARQRTPKCLELLERAREDEACPWAVRVRASEILLDRGHGRAVSVIEMSVTHERSITSLTRDELRAIAAGQVPPTPITIEGEVLEAGLVVHDVVQPSEDGAT
jgi:hypothetical protein